MAESKSNEVYETPDVADDEIDAPVTAAQASSSEDGPIVTTQFDPTESFKKFADSKLDSRGKDFSDSVGKPSKLSQRTRYEVVNKRAGEQGEEGDVLETPMQRYERLRAEVTSFLRDIENIRNGRGKGAESSVVGVEEDLDGTTLIEMADKLKIWQSQLQTAAKADSGLDTLTMGGGSVRLTMQSDLTSQLLSRIASLKTGGAVEVSGEAGAPSTTSSSQGSMAYELVYSKDAAKEMKIARLADLERRLASLEQVVVGRVAPDAADLPSHAQGLLATIDDVRSQVSSLDHRAIEQLSHRILKLTKNYQALQAIKEAYTQDASSSSISREQIDKINSVYTSLSHVETVSTELPVVVERLVQLRTLHEQAVNFAAHISSISSSQSELSTVLRANLEGINRMQQSLTSNITTIEKNVLALEKRIADVSSMLAK